MKEQPHICPLCGRAYLSRGYIREVVIDIGRSALSSN